MLVESRDIMPRNADRLRGVTIVGAPNIKYVISHIPPLMLTGVIGDRDSSPSSTTKIEVGRQPT